MLVIFLETSRNISVNYPKFYEWLNCQNFPKYFSKMSEVSLEIFQNLSRNFLKWFSKFSDKIFMWRTSPPSHYGFPAFHSLQWYRNHFHHRRHHRATPVPPPRCPSTSVVFFLTLRFSNLVPYVAILKTFHIKNLK